MKDYYKTLNLKFGANEEEIRKAYRILAQKYHPDKNLGNKEYDELFKEINEAYSTLNDSLKKSNFDKKYEETFFKHSSSNNFHNTNNNKNENPEKPYFLNREDINMNKNNIISKTKLYKNKNYIIFFSLLVVGFAFLINKWNNISEYFEEKDKKNKYEQLISSILGTKKFQDIDMSGLKSKASLETKWKDNKMYYKFHLLSMIEESEISNKKLLSDSLQNILNFEKRIEKIEKINLIFEDKDGFKIFELNIDVQDMTILDDKYENIVGIKINSNISILPDLYKEFQGWTITYQESIKETISIDEFYNPKGK